MNKQITIANETVTLDEYGRISLNILHRLSDTGRSKEPGQWLRLASTQELIEVLGQDADLHHGQNLIEVVHGGNNSGTYAHELLAVSYAGWISPRFQLQVNQAFLDSKRQKPVAELISISKDEYIDLLKSKIQLLEHRKQKNKNRRANTPLSQQEKTKIVLLHRQGLSNRQIAEQLNRSVATVWALVR